MTCVFQIIKGGAGGGEVKGQGCVFVFVLCLFLLCFEVRRVVLG